MTVERGGTGGEGRLRGSTQIYVRVMECKLTIPDGMGKYDGMGKDIKNTKYNIKY